MAPIFKKISTVWKHPVAIIVISVAIFIAYDKVNANQEAVALAGKVKDRSVAYVNGKYRVDTSFIRNDLNKAKLIAGLENQVLKQKKTIQEVPEFIWRFLDSISCDRKFDIVNPGEEWNEGITNYGHVVFKKVWDATKKDSVPMISCDGVVLPNKQLVYFGIGKDIALMSYMHGGLWSQSNILIFKHKDNKITDLWFGGGESIRNKSELLKSLKAPRQNGC